MRKPWPEIVKGEYYSLVKNAESLVYLADLLFNKAVFGRRNPALLDLILAELRRLHHTALIANQKRQQLPKGKRYPGERGV